MPTYILCVVIDNKMRAAGEKPEDFASDAEAAMYWLQYCKDACGRAAERHRLEREARRGYRHN